MGNFLSKIKYFMGLEDFDEEYVDVDEYFDYDEYHEEADLDTESVEEEEVNIEDNIPRRDNVVSIHNNSKEKGNIAKFNMRIVIHEPKIYDEAPKIVDDLKSRKVAVINFEGLDLELKRQIFDFVNGALYSMEGKIQKVTKDIFIVAPKHVEIDGIKDELKNTGIFPWEL